MINKKTSDYFFLVFNSLPAKYAPIMIRIRPSTQPNIAFSCTLVVAAYTNQIKPQIIKTTPANTIDCFISISPQNTISIEFNKILENTIIVQSRIICIFNPFYG